MHVMTACGVADQNNCYHMYATQTNYYSFFIYVYNKCCSAWQQLRDVKKHTFWCSYVLDSLQNIVCECAQIQNTCMKEESAKNFGATNSRYLTENMFNVSSALITNYFGYYLSTWSINQIYPSEILDITLKNDTT